MASIKDIRKMDMVARRFIGEAMSFFHFNNKQVSIKSFTPKTKKSFYLKYNNETILFSAADIKGANGIFKLAKIISS